MMTTTQVGRHRREKGTAPTAVLHAVLLDHSDSPGTLGRWRAKAKELLDALRRDTQGEDVLVKAPYFRRHCYDKPHRCPGWAGGGLKYPKPGKDWCDGGSLEITWRTERMWENDPWLVWRWHRCNTCGVRALPIAIKYFDLVWWWTWKLDPATGLRHFAYDFDQLLKDGDWRWFWRNRTSHIRFWPWSVKRWFERLGRWWHKDYERD